ncbi:unnamed protein product [Cuscuta campestris]|uniref:Transposase MuDR plant domain-containing protein n=1 Tax=Cuscuta campestris TaxID=132261 RepID=A0A484M0D9_9ASTE|nr:unnamed protein product [Cuscuta campestris]
MKGNSQLGSKWITKEFLDVFKAKPHWPAKEIQDAVKEKFKYFITRCVAYRAKWWAHKMLHGSMKEHYRKLPIYMAALHLSSPNTILKLAVRNIWKGQGIHRVQVGAPKFRRLFGLLKAVTEVFPTAEPAKVPMKRPRGRPRKGVQQVGEVLDSSQAGVHHRTAEPSVRDACWISCLLQ